MIAQGGTLSPEGADKSKKCPQPSSSSYYPAHSTLRLEFHLIVCMILVAIPASVATNEDSKNYWSPMFTSQPYVITVMENIPPGSRVIQVRAHDNDPGMNGELTYSIENGSDPDGYFTMDPSTGEVTVEQPLDFEYKRSLTLTIKATDKGTPPMYSTAELMVFVYDVNDNPPIFYHDMYGAAIEKGVAVGTQVVKVKAVDMDSGMNGEITYSIDDKESNYGGYFSVDKTTGDIKVAKELDQVKEPRVNFIVKAVDHGMPSGYATVEVDVMLHETHERQPLP